jgi:2-dehydropantoate 2-reductase
MKSQHTISALDDLRNAAGDNIPVICCQNGTANERMALRRFRRVYGMVVMLPASHMEPGAVQSESTPVTGILDAGCYPSGVDSLIEEITKSLSASTFSSYPQTKIMRWKYAKLLMNLNNALQALCDARGSEIREIQQMAFNEATACFQAAGIDCASQEEFYNRRGDMIRVGTIKGRQRGGSSSWQSIARGTGSIEADYLNGEIAYLGRRHGIPTPANATLQRLAMKMAHERSLPGSFSVEQLRKLINEQSGQ